MIPHRLALLASAGLLVVSTTLSAGAAPPASEAQTLGAAARALAAGDADLALRTLATLPDRLDPAVPVPAWVGQADLLRGVAALRAGRPAEAIIPLERAAVRVAAVADVARIRRAEAIRLTGDASLAAQEYDRFLRDFPDSPWAAEAAGALGGARADAGDLAGAVAADRSFLATRQASEQADAVRLRLGASLEALGRTDEAAGVYRALVVERPLTRVADEAGSRLAKLGGPRSPLRLLSNEERLTRGLILFDAYRSGEALRDLEAVDLDKLPGGEVGAQAQDVRLKRGLALFRLRRYPEAARELESLALLATAAGQEARFWRARALARQGRSREAIAEFTAIADETPGSRFADQAAYLAAVVLDDQGEPDEAAARLRALAARAGRAPLAADALWQIAWTRYRAGDLAAADGGFAELMRRFAGSDVADRAAYWRARAELKVGRADLGLPRLVDLVQRRPLSWYGIQAARRLDEHDREAARLPAASAEPAPPVSEGTFACCRLPIEPAPPPPLERATLLVSLGLLPEARTELLVLQRAGRPLPALDVARLLHAAGDYHRPLATARVMAGVPLERLDLDPERRLFPLAFPRGYRAAVEAQAKASGVPVHFAYAIIRAESLFDPTAISPVGARGLMQLMPATAESLAAALGARPFDVDLLFSPEANVRFGVTLLGRLLAKYPGRPHLAMAAYNAGPEAVSSWLDAFGSLPEDEFVESIPFTETRGYVMKVTAFWKTYDALYGT